MFYGESVNDSSSAVEGQGMAYDARRLERGGYRGDVYECERQRERVLVFVVVIGTSRNS